VNDVPALAVVGMNLGGPDSLDAVEPFLENLFRDPDVIHLGWARPLQSLFARVVSHQRAPLSRRAYEQIGGRSPLFAETTAQVAAVVARLASTGVAAKPYVAMACWHPFSWEAVAAVGRDGLRRAIALPFYPQYSETTTGSSLKALRRAAAARGTAGIEIAAIRSYPVAEGFVTALADSLVDAIATLPASLRAAAPVLFSAHGLPESYIRQGDPYLDEVRSTVVAVTRRLALGARAQLSFQSRVGRRRWLGPDTEDALDAVAESGATAVVVCPVAFTGEHLETLQELDIVYRQRALARGLKYFARARAVGTHPAFIDALAGLTRDAAAARGWI
jgi:ferrochelatase